MMGLHLGIVCGWSDVNIENTEVCILNSSSLSPAPITNQTVQKNQAMYMLG